MTSPYSIGSAKASEASAVSIVGTDRSIPSRGARNKRRNPRIYIYIGISSPQGLFVGLEPFYSLLVTRAYF